MKKPVKAAKSTPKSKVAAKPTKKKSIPASAKGRGKKDEDDDDFKEKVAEEEEDMDLPLDDDFKGFDDFYGDVNEDDDDDF